MCPMKRKQIISFPCRRRRLLLSPGTVEEKVSLLSPPPPSLLQEIAGFQRLQEFLLVGDCLLW